MALTEREQNSAGGPNGGTVWSDSGESQPFAQITNNSTSYTDVFVTIVSSVDTKLAGGLSVDDYLAAGAPIQRLTSGWITLSAVLAASNLQILGLAVHRNEGVLNAQIAAAGGALTSLPFTPNTALPVGHVITLTNLLGGSPQTWTTTAAVAVGVTAVPVSSQTPGATYPVGSTGSGVVGLGTACPSGLCLGWIGTGSGTTGTPVFPPFVSVALPMLTVNPNVTPALDMYLLPGDAVTMRYAVTSSSVTIPAGMVYAQKV